MTQPKKRIMTPDQLALAERLAASRMLEVTSEVGLKEAKREMRECNILINEMPSDQRARIFFESDDIIKADGVV